MINVPVKSYTMVCVMLKVRAVKIKVTTFVVLAIVYFNAFQDPNEPSVQEGSLCFKCKTK